MSRVFRITRLLVTGLSLAFAACNDPVAPSREPGDEPTDTVASPAREARVVWISRFDWYDQAELRELLVAAASANFNIVYFQVRGRADAYYRSNLEPWAHRPPAFTLGSDPGWDPLAVALATAHNHGLELHVWLNALIGWCTSEPIPETTPRHVLLAHASWKMVNQSGQSTAENCTFLTPGDSGVRSWLAAVSADIARRYPIDGVHLDYIRYPDPSFSYDDQTEAAFEEARRTEPGLTYDELRRRLVTATVREVRDSLRAVSRSLPLSAAVWGVYRNARGWTNVSTGFDTRFQDSWGWAAAGIADAIAPMVYWNIKPTYGERLDFAYLADEFARGVTARHVYVGMGVEEGSSGFCLGCDVVRQIYRARRAGATGVSVFSGRLLRENGLWDELRAGPFKQRVPVPAMPWLTTTVAASTKRYRNR